MTAPRHGRRPQVSRTLIYALACSFSLMAGCLPNEPIPRPPTKAESSQPPSVASASAARPDTDAEPDRLAFDLPDGSPSGKLVFAHYFTPYPISLDNEEPSRDYYARNYLRPEGENGKFAEVGGLLRDRPLPRDPLPGDWVVDDLRAEVRQASAVGIDGFIVDILSLTGVQWRRTQLLIRAAEAENPNFRIMLMPDMTASTGQAGPEELASRMSELADSNSVYRLADGRLVVSPYKAEERSANWWRRFVDLMARDHGERVTLLPVFHDPSAHLDGFAPISHGFGEWGARNAEYVAAAPDWAAKSRALGKVWMAPVAVQDVRPYGATFDEADNTSTLRATWNRAIEDGADLVQLVTWNDYAESTSFAPSVAHGWAFLSLSAYFAYVFKTGQPPVVVRDAVYVTHRMHDYRLQPTSGHRIAVLRGGTRPVNRVEVVTLLTEPADVEVRVGDVRMHYRVGSGLHVKSFPLGAGRVSARVLRQGGVVADACGSTSVKTSIAVQDLQYYAAVGLQGVTPRCT